MTHRDRAVYACNHGGTYASAQELMMALLEKQGVRPVPACPYDAWHAWRGGRQGLGTECPVSTQDNSHDAWLAVARDCVQLETEESFMDMLRHIAGGYREYKADEIQAILGGYIEFLKDFWPCTQCHEDCVAWDSLDRSETWPAGTENVRFCSPECRDRYEVEHGYNTHIEETLR